MRRPLDAHPREATVVLGLSADQRYLGASVLIAGKVASIVTETVDRRRTGASALLGEHVHELVVGYAPDLMVVVPQADGGAAQASERDPLAVPAHETASKHEVSIVRLSLQEIARDLCLTRPTYADLQRHLARTYPLVGQKVRPVRGRQSESERYWKAALLALGGALAITGWHAAAAQRQRTVPVALRQGRFRAPSP